MTVRKKGNKWYCRFQIDGVRYERRCDLAVDEKSAKQAEAIIKTEIMRGNLNYAKAKKAPKLKDGLELFITHSENNKESHKTDLSHVKKIKDFFGENYILEQITPGRIEEFKAHIKTYTKKELVKINNPDYKKNGCRKKFIYKEVEKLRTRSNATVNRHIEVLSKIFSLCVDNKILSENPCRSVQDLREENFKIRFLTIEEEHALFSAIEAPHVNAKGVVTYPYIHLKPLIICALQTGMRRGEIFNLKWAHIDFKDGFIEVLKTKSGKARKIPISPRLETLLKDMLANSTNDYVFINPETNKPYVDIKRAFSSVIKNANISNFRFHDLRHTVATRMVESGADLLVVKEILGHSDIKTTMRYAHPVPENKRRAINYLSNLY